MDKTPDLLSGFRLLFVEAEQHHVDRVVIIPTPEHNAVHADQRCLQLQLDVGEQTLGFQLHRSRETDCHTYGTDIENRA